MLLGQLDQACAEQSLGGLPDLCVGGPRVLPHRSNPLYLGYRVMIVVPSILRFWDPASVADHFSIYQVLNVVPNISMKLLINLLIMTMSIYALTWVPKHSK